MTQSDESPGDFFWKMYQENTAQGRHHEMQRSALATSLIAISGAVIGVVTFNRDLTTWDLPLTLFLVLLGVFGGIFSAKQYERFCLHMERARGYRDALDALLPNSPLARIKKTADRNHKEKHPTLVALRLNAFWLALYGAIAGLGIILSGIALFAPIEAA